MKHFYVKNTDESVIGVIAAENAEEMRNKIEVCVKDNYDLDEKVEVLNANFDFYEEHDVYCKTSGETYCLYVGLVGLY